jgi:hypothetical protein
MDAATAISAKEIPTPPSVNQPMSSIVRYVFASAVASPLPGKSIRGADQMVSQAARTGLGGAV